MPILNLKKNKRVKDKIRLVTQRISCFIFIPTELKTVRGFVFVADLTGEVVSFYADRSFRQGIDLQISFEKQDGYAFRTKAVTCNRMALTQSFLGTPALNFFVTAQWAFSSDAERVQYEKFLTELKDRLLLINRIAENFEKLKKAA